MPNYVIDQISVARRLREGLELKGWKPVDIEKHTDNVKAHTLRNWLREEAAEAPKDYSISLFKECCRALGLNDNYVLYGINPNPFEDELNAQIDTNLLEASIDSALEAIMLSGSATSAEELKLVVPTIAKVAQNVYAKTSAAQAKTGSDGLAITYSKSPSDAVPSPSS